MKCPVWGIQSITTKYFCMVMYCSWTRDHLKLCVVVQSLGSAHVTSWATACQFSPSFTISQSLLKFMSVELVMLSNHLILCCSPSPPALISPSPQNRRKKKLHGSIKNNV